MDKKKKKLRAVYVGVVHHKHGSDIFVGWTEAQVNAKLYVYVQEWWEDFVHDRDVPKNKDKAISDYFEAAADEEYLDILADVLPVNG